MLHDAVEDQGGEPRLSDIRNRFGDRVAEIVRSCSDSTAHGRPKDDWKTRKERYLAHLETVDQETLLVSLADKIHNARSILLDSRKPDPGPAIWKRFGRPKEDSIWYCRQLERVFRRKRQDQLSDELRDIVDELEKA
jgi:(p)ppGpp synthase/HD superfamily hydrolase